MRPGRGMAVALALLWCGCTMPNPDFQPGGWDGITIDGGHPPIFPFGTDSREPAAPDGLPSVATDGGPSAITDLEPPPPPSDNQPPPVTGTGKICQGPAECPTDEICVFVQPDHDKGICLRPCTNYNQPCSVTQPELSSGCAKYTNEVMGTIWACVFFCKVGTKTFPCPNAVEYSCKSFGSMGMCVAKQ